MKIYSVKKLISGFIEIMLSILGIITLLLSKNVDFKFTILVFVCFLIGCVSIKQSFQRIQKEDLIDLLDERNQIIILKVHDKLIKIFSYIIVSSVACCVCLYNISHDTNYILIALPFMITMVLYYILYIFLCFYFNKQL